MYSSLVAVLLGCTLVCQSGCRSSGPYGHGWGNATEVHKAVWAKNTRSVESLAAAKVPLDVPAAIPACWTPMTDCSFSARPLDLAGRRGSRAMFDALLAQGVRPSAHHLAVAIWTGDDHDQAWRERGSIAYIEDLIAAGLDPNQPSDQYRGSLALYAAVLHGNLPACRVLLANGARADARVSDNSGVLNLYPLSPAIVRLLLEHGADATLVDSEGNSALNKLWHAKDSESVRLLIHAGADPRLANKKGETPLSRNPTGIIAFTLTTLGADVRNQTPDGRTLLHAAILSTSDDGIDATVKHYVSSGVAINAQDSHGDTALHLALSSSSPTLDRVRALLGSGALTTIRNEAGLTPIDLARERVKLCETEMERVNPIASRQGTAQGLISYENSLRTAQKILALLEQGE